MYSWVSEGSVRKYHRAVAELQKAKQEVTEEAVKALYVKWGGLVLGDESSVLGNDDPAEALANATPAAEEVAPAPKKKAKKAE